MISRGCTDTYYVIFKSAEYDRPTAKAVTSARHNLVILCSWIDESDDGYRSSGGFRVVHIFSYCIYLRRASRANRVHSRQITRDTQIQSR